MLNILKLTSKTDSNDISSTWAHYSCQSTHWFTYTKDKIESVILSWKEIFVNTRKSQILVKFLLKGYFLKYSACNHPFYFIFTTENSF